MEPTKGKDIEVTTFRSSSPTTDKGSSERSSSGEVFKDQVSLIQKNHENSVQSKGNDKSFRVLKGKASNAIDPGAKSTRDKSERVSFPILNAVYRWVFPKKLDYSGSKLEEIPSEVLEKNKDLEELDLSDSEIATFPDLSKCKKLRKIDLTQTFLNQDKEIIASCLPKDHPVVIEGVSDSSWPQFVEVRKLGKNKVEVTVKSDQSIVVKQTPSGASSSLASLVEKTRQSLEKLKKSPIELKEELRSWDIEDQRICLGNNGFSMGMSRVAQSNAGSAVGKIVDFIAGNATELDLHDISIASIPGSVFETGRLKAFDCSLNSDLTSLPPEISDCSTLERLNVSNTGLTSMPNLSKCKKLTEIDLAMTGLRYNNLDLARLPQGVPLKIKGVGKDKVKPTASFDVDIKSSDREGVTIIIKQKAVSQ